MIEEQKFEQGYLHGTQFQTPNIIFYMDGSIIEDIVSDQPVAVYVINKNDDKYVDIVTSGDSVLVDINPQFVNKKIIN